MPEYLQYVDVVFAHAPTDDSDLVAEVVQDQDGNQVHLPVIKRADGRYVLRFPARFAELDPRSLPSWDALSDIDKGCVLMFLQKVDFEGEDYARSDYPAKFVDDEVLAALDPRDACDYAIGFEDQHSSEQALADGDIDEWQRLYDLAEAATRER